VATRKKSQQPDKPAKSKKRANRSRANARLNQAGPESQEPPIRIAIVGGGCAGLSAAWQLSQHSGYEVHVYERSWKLGGKAASVRDRDGRIKEHGLHVWLGFYENAFRMMRECYAEVERRRSKSEPLKGPLVHGSVEEAFLPEPHVGVAGLGSANVWSGFLPPAKGSPGEPLDEETNPFTLASYLLRCFDLLKTLMLSVIGSPTEDNPGEPRPDQRSSIDEAMDLDFSFDATRSPGVLVDRIAKFLRTGTLTTAAGLLQAVSILEKVLRELNFAPQVADSAIQLLEAIAAQTRKQLRDLVAVDQKLRWKTEIIDIVMAIAVGLFRDRVLFQKNGLDAINHVDYRNWLMQHGASRTTVDSRFITGIYDLVFAYQDGDKNRPALAAGVALRGALRMFFTYRGSMFWRMRSGMGEAVFAPLYKVMLQDTRLLKNRRVTNVSPVKFHFLHTLAAVEIQKVNGLRRVTQLTFRTEGNPNGLDALGGDALDHAGCWPDDARHFATAIDTQATHRRVLDYGADGFDAVIFAVGIDDFLDVCAGGRPGKDPGKNDFYEIMGPEWVNMGREVQTVATQAAQAWFDNDLDELGWHRGSGLITALNMPFDTWGDMTHTLPAEKAWRKPGRRGDVPTSSARSVAYFCGVLSQQDVDQRRDLLRREASRMLDYWASRLRSAAAKGKAAQVRAKIRSVNDHIQRLRSEMQANEDAAMDVALAAKVGENLDTLLKDKIRSVWPAAFTSNLTALDHEIGRHVQANYRGSDRYTLSLPGSIDDRISPLDRTVENMVIAGDWTACGLDVGCVEAAVMSGMLAAHAITKEPSLDSIVGYHHP
jgi:uncharacterized protein with NAD-binding domain and iron-sulfur cluster